MDKVVLAVFQLDGGRYALPLDMVERVELAAMPTPLAGAPKVVRGLIDVRGQLVPVIDMRQRLGLDSRPLRPEDHFVLARTARRAYFLWVDSALGVDEAEPGGVQAVSGLSPGLPELAGVVRLPGGITYIYDLDACLSLEEEAALDASVLRAVLGEDHG